MTERLNTGLSELTRKKVVDGLISLLANSYILYLKTHNFHWNVTGPMFQSLHILFETQYTEIWNAVDEIAERIRALGFGVPASHKDFFDLTEVQESIGNCSIKADSMIRQLMEDLEIVVRLARELLPQVEMIKDQVTADLLSERMRVHESNAWMLRSLLE